MVSTAEENVHVRVIWINIQPTNCLSVFDHSVGFALKGKYVRYQSIVHICQGKYWPLAQRIITQKIKF